ncbi:heavy metal translocating P-type ATPase [Lentisalinibacter sediminis]|uniref:heavy metal translocating P-type ATPase n=1 Tax=Lentisalinibacter sediminis TaxID=2992237 RepID=UPI003868E1C1
MSAARRDVLTVDGMFCAACAASVEAVLARQPGVASAAVNFAADAAVVEWQPGAHDTAPLVDAVRRLGYDTRLIGDDSAARSPAGDPARDLGLRLIVALFFGMWAMLPSIVLYLDVVTDPSSRYGLALAAGLFSLPVVLYAGLPFYRMGIATLRHGVAGVDALVTVGVAGSLILSGIALLSGGAEVYFEVAVALVSLQLIARLLDLRVRRKARDAVVGLLELAPTRLTVVDDDGVSRRVALKEVGPGDAVRVGTGERLAVDGRIFAGRARIDRSLLTGESDPVTLGPDDSLHAGEYVIDGACDLRVTASAGKRRIDGLARQVREMLAARPAWQRAADTVARHFLWLSVLAAAAGAALVLTAGGTPSEAAVRALAVFVIACPCALSLAAPIVGLTASAAAARRGIILRDLNAVTAAAVPDRVFIDKTGTLTLGRPGVVAVHVCGGADERQVLRAAATAEHASPHPIARALVAAAEESGMSAAALAAAAAEGELHDSPGRGVRWARGEGTIVVGSIDWLRAAGVDIPALPATSATRAGVARNGRLIGVVDLEDALRPGIEEGIRALRSRGLAPVILSGDGPGPVARIGARLGCEAHAGLTPEEKVRRIAQARKAGATTAFVGDGINDGPALAAADLGVAVGQATDAARSAAAVSLVEADATALPALFDLTRRARRIVRENLTWAIAYNSVAIPAAMAGWVHPAVAALAMALSSVTIVLNALRAG